MRNDRQTSFVDIGAIRAFGVRDTLQMQPKKHAQPKWYLSVQPTSTTCRAIPLAIDLPTEPFTVAASFILDFQLL